MEKEKVVPVSERSFGDRVKFAISHWAKRRFQKIAISNYKGMRKDEYIPKSPYEKEAIRICRNIIVTKGTELRVDPEISERYIVNESLNMYVFINEGSVDIIKNNFPHNVPLSVKALKTITIIFNKHAHMDRTIYKNKVYANLKLTIESILDETTKASPITNTDSNSLKKANEVADNKNS